MEMEVHKVWSRVLELMERGISPQSFGAWLKPIKAIGLKEGLLTVEVPNRFAKGWVNSRYLPLIEKTVKEVVGTEVKVSFVVSQTGQRSPRKAMEGEGAVSVQKHKDAFLASQFDPKYTFDSFVVGSSNRFAHAASLAVAESPGRSYNPLFIYGGVGLGKTHLLNAIGCFIKTHSVKAKVIYLTSEMFMNEMISSIRYGKTLEFRNKYRKMDVLLLDDIHFLAGKEGTQEEFFHTFNALYDTHKQIVITSDRPPKEIPNLEERLRSRFEWGLIADLQPPDFETRMAILRKKVELESLYVPDEVLNFIATRVKSNIREMEGSLLRVVAFSSLLKNEASLELAKEVLKDTLLIEEEKRISIDLIQHVVANYFGLHTSDMRAKRRTQAVAFPRQIAMYLARELTDLSLPAIGEGFGGRDHTTVIHACNKIGSQLKSDVRLSRTIDYLITEIKG